MHGSRATELSFADKNKSYAEVQQTFDAEVKYSVDDVVLWLQEQVDKLKIK
jgi:hypothetical protein